MSDGKDEAAQAKLDEVMPLVDALREELSKKYGSAVLITITVADGSGVHSLSRCATDIERTRLPHVLSTHIQRAEICVTLVAGDDEQGRLTQVATALELLAKPLDVGGGFTRIIDYGKREDGV